MGSTVALLLAAGSGNRLGRQPKGFVDLGGVPLFIHSYRAMAACPEIDRIVILVPDGYVEAARRSIESIGPGAGPDVRIGGETRPESVRSGLAALPNQVEVVICHDAARPFASPELFRRVLGGLAGVQGVVPVVASPDTVKRVRDGRVIETVPRNELRLAQTPQAFTAEALVEAHRRAGQAGVESTDDAMLLEAAGYHVAAVEGDPSNFKITTPEDLRRAEFLLADLQGAPEASERIR